MYLHSYAMFLLVVGVLQMTKLPLCVASVDHVVCFRVFQQMVFDVKKGHSYNIYFHYA